MRLRVRENLPASAAAALGILVVGWLGLTDWLWTDYDNEARPAIDALLQGHLTRFAALAPSYGGSLVLRAPFIFIPKLWGGGELAVYRAAAAPCLLASAMLGVWLVSRMRAAGVTRIARGAALMLCVANPMTLSTLESGHPEELLGGVLCVAAVLVAMRGRPIWAGVLLGLAVANQEWALVAVGPVLIALPRARIRALIAGGTAAALVLLPLLAGGKFLGQVNAAARPGGSSIFTPWQLWWFLGPHRHVLPAGQPWNTRFDPAWLTQLAHPLIIVVAAMLSLGCLWLRRRQAFRPAYEPLLLLGLVLLVRCALDPWDNWYYPLPYLLALLSWEVLATRRAPAVGLIASFGGWFVFQWAVPSRGFSPDAQSLLFLAWALPALATMGIALYSPTLARRLRGLATRSSAVPATA
jgi:hypothetical protein